MYLEITGNEIYMILISRKDQSIVQYIYNKHHDLIGISREDTLILESTYGQY
jgi:hypothetical protein